jgi:hypothetical protein
MSVKAWITALLATIERLQQENEILRGELRDARNREIGNAH